MERQILARVRKLIAPILEEEGVDLIDLELKGLGGRRTLRVFIDTDTGIRLEECVRVSERISALLDVEDPIAGRYTLEVSSPGLDRPLRTARDFRKNLGRTVWIVYHTNDRRERVEGIVQEVTDTSVTLRGTSGEALIPLTAIQRAQVKLQW